MRQYLENGTRYDQVTRKLSVRFRLAPKSMTLDDLELDGGRPPLFSSRPLLKLTYNIETWCLVLGWGFWLNLIFYHRGLHARTAVARNPCVSWAFLYQVNTIQRLLCSTKKSIRTAIRTEAIAYNQARAKQMPIRLERQSLFSGRVIDRWNGLERCVIDSATGNAFKNGLRWTRNNKMGFFMD